MRRKWDVLPDWPELIQPTPQQLAEWLKICSDGDRLQFAEIFQQNANDASACWMFNHVNEIENLRLNFRSPLRRTLWWTPTGVY